MKSKNLLRRLRLGTGTSAGTPRSFTVTAGATGVLTTLSRLYGSSSTFSLLAGSNANLAINSATGALSATAGIADGASQLALVREALTASNLASEYPVTLTGAVVLTVPAAPAITLSAGNGQVSITWTDGSTGGATITSHKLYRNGELLGSIIGASPYVDTGLTNSVSYAYRLSAVTSVGEGALSAQQSATPIALDNALLDQSGNFLTADNGDYLLAA